VNAELRVDNQSAIQLIKFGQFGKRSKHIDVRYHFIVEKVREGFLNVNFYPSDEQVADVLTKPLGRLKFELFRNRILTLF